MEVQEIKNLLRDDPDLIVELLESMDFHHIKNIRDQRISGAFPDGDNIGSLQILLNDDDEGNAYLYTCSNTRAFEGGDFFSFIKWHLNLKSNSEAINFVAGEVGVKYTYVVDDRKPSECARFLRSYIRKKDKPDTYEEVILSGVELEQFYDIPCKIFADDGIDKETQKKFGVMYDYWDNRAVFPVRNDYGQLITVKGRTLNENYKYEDIIKYMYYYNYSGAYYLYGLYENMHNILEMDEIILIEPEKGVMQADSFGVKNVVALSKKKITPQQVKKVLTLGVRNVTMMLDKDVTEEEIRNECAKFRGLINVWYTLDYDNLLDENDAPTDKGYDIFDCIYNNRKKYKED